MSIAEKLTTITENQQKVYDAGVAAGQASGGYSDGYSAGQQAEYDRFWDDYQDNGTRTNYDLAFTGIGWDNDLFQPKYTINPKSGYMMFYKTAFQGDLMEHLNNLGVTIDTSNLTNAQYMFASNSGITRIGEIDLSKVTNGYYIFQSASALQTIDKLIFSETTQTYQAFYYCYALENITIDGVIPTGQYFGHSANLTNESVQSIIDHLKDRTGLDAHNLTFHANVGARLTDVQKAAITAKNWNLVY